VQAWKDGRKMEMMMMMIITQSKSVYNHRIQYATQISFCTTVGQTVKYVSTTVPPIAAHVISEKATQYHLPNTHI